MLNLVKGNEKVVLGPAKEIEEKPIDIGILFLKQEKYS